MHLYVLIHIYMVCVIIIHFVLQRNIFIRFRSKCHYCFWPKFYTSQVSLCTTKHIIMVQNVHSECLKSKLVWISVSCVPFPDSLDFRHCLKSGQKMFEIWTKLEHFINFYDLGYYRKWDNFLSWFWHFPVFGCSVFTVMHIHMYKCV